MKLRDEQPEIFLPTDIDYTLEDALEDKKVNENNDNDEGALRWMV